MAGESLLPVATKPDVLGSTRPCLRLGLVLFAPKQSLSAPAWDAYRETFRQVMAILRGYTPLVEPLFLDEVYLDVTGATTDGTLTVDIAHEILTRIQRETGLTASVGVSYNKLLAKFASDWRKPHWLFFIPPERGRAFFTPLPMGKLHGVSPATVQRFLLQWALNPCRICEPSRGRLL